MEKGVVIYMTVEEFKANIRKATEEVLAERSPKYLRAEDTAEKLGITLPALYTLTHRKRIPFLKKGRKYQFGVSKGHE